MEYLRKIRVGIVPSWLAELITRHPTASYKDLLNFTILDGLDGKASILTREELFIYILAQQLQPSIMKGAFTDLHNIVSAPENLAFCASVQPELDRLQDALSTRRKLEKALGDSDNNMSHFIAEGGSPVEVENYVPLAVAGDTLFLIGSSEPTFKDNRAFFNAVMEQVATLAEFPEFKKTLVFKHYLRHAVSDR